MITQTFDLNLIPDSAPVVVHCDQYDKGTGRLVINLYDGAIAYSPSGTAVIQGTKPDGRGFDYSCSLSGNVVTANLTEQMTAVAGQVRTQIVVTESTGRTGTFVFILDVQRSALPADTDMSESDYQLIEQAIEETQQAAEDAESWAIGKRGGQDVPSTDPAYHNNAKYWADQASQYAQGGLHYAGTCLFANIPTIGMSDGEMWNIEDDFTTDSRFREGAGISVAAGSNIAWVSTDSKWDVLAMAKVSSLNDLTNVDITSPSANDFLGYDPQSSEWKNIPISIAPMTASTLGIGKPDGKTATVDGTGTFSAVGVAIPAEVNSGGTQYGSNWLYYAGTTEVITPSTSQNYRVIESGTAKLYYWSGTSYLELTSGGGGGGGMNIDGSNAASAIAFPSESIQSGRFGKSWGGFAFSHQIMTEAETGTSLRTILANTTTETKLGTYSIITYPYMRFWLDTSSPSRITVDSSYSTDHTLTYDGKTIRIHRENDIIELWATNTTASDYYVRLTLQQRTISQYDSLAIGGDCSSSKRFCVAIGRSCHASGDYSQAFGEVSNATGEGSHAEGFNTYAVGMFSHAEGRGTRSGGVGSHAEGFDTKASSDYQHVSGKYNVEDSADTYALIIGNGTSNSARSNAFTVDWNGNACDGTGKKLTNAGEITNPNLLDNPWFTINQRGASSYSSNANSIYTVDRWKIDSNGVATVTPKSVGIGITRTDGYYASFFQLIEKSRFRDNQTYTLSILFSDGHIESKSGVIADSQSQTRYIQTDAYNDMVGFVDTWASSTMYTVGIYNTSGTTNEVVIIAVKLEIGSISTLALDTAPNYATELLKCQRYFVRYTGAGSSLATGMCINGNNNGSLRFMFGMPVVMRTSPVLTYSSLNDFKYTKTDGAGGVNPTAISKIGTFGNQLSIELKGASGLPINVGETITMYSANSSGYIDLSADL